MSANRASPGEGTTKLDVPRLVGRLEHYAECYARDAVRDADLFADYPPVAEYSAMMAAQLRALASALPELVDDGARLDWLELHAIDISIRLAGEHISSDRASIDEARAARTAVPGTAEND